MSVFYTPGLYNVRFTEQGITMSKAGKPQIVIRFKVLEAADGGEVEQRERSMFLSLSDGALPYTKVTLQALGLGGLTPEQIASEEYSLVGQEKVLSCRIEEASGDYPEKERWNTQRQVTPMEKASAATLREINARFAKKLTEGIQPPAKPAAVAAPVTVPDDVIPF